jgi:fused signal recognition particle receptor
MDELKKMIRVVQKIDPTAPHEILLVLDGTTGQNAHQQIAIFKKEAAVTGLILTKLDGTAKGGVVVALAAQHGLPIYALGVGEKIDDLQPFSAAVFAKNLVGMPYSES